MVGLGGLVGLGGCLGYVGWPGCVRNFARYLPFFLRFDVAGPAVAGARSPPNIFAITGLKTLAVLFVIAVYPWTGLV